MVQKFFFRVSCLNRFLPAESSEDTINGIRPPNRLLLRYAELSFLSDCLYRMHWNSTNFTQFLLFRISILQLPYVSIQHFRLPCRIKSIDCSIDWRLSSEPATYHFPLLSFLLIHQIPFFKFILFTFYIAVSATSYSILAPLVNSWRRAVIWLVQLPQHNRVQKDCSFGLNPSTSVAVTLRWTRKLDCCRGAAWTDVIIVAIVYILKNALAKVVRIMLNSKAGKVFCWSSKLALASDWSARELQSCHLKKCRTMPVCSSFLAIFVTDYIPTSSLRSVWQVSVVSCVKEIWNRVECVWKYSTRVTLAVNSILLL